MAHATEIKLKLWDKQKAINDLARMLGWNGGKEEDLPEELR